MILRNLAFGSFGSEKIKFLDERPQHSLLLTDSLNVSFLFILLCLVRITDPTDEVVYLTGVFAEGLFENSLSNAPPLVHRWIIEPKTFDIFGQLVSQKIDRSFSIGIV